MRLCLFVTTEYILPVCDQKYQDPVVRLCLFVTTNVKNQVVPASVLQIIASCVPPDLSAP